MGGCCRAVADWSGQYSGLVTLWSAGRSLPQEISAQRAVLRVLGVDQLVSSRAANQFYYASLRRIYRFFWLATVPLTSGTVAQIFGARYLSTLYGIVFLSYQLGSFTGVWIAGRLHDASG